jgi:hypothetical protein
MIMQGHLAPNGHGGDSSVVYEITVVAQGVGRSGIHFSWRKRRLRQTLTTKNEFLNARPPTSRNRCFMNGVRFGL